MAGDPEGTTNGNGGQNGGPENGNGNAGESREAQDRRIQQLTEEIQNQPVVDVINMVKGIIEDQRLQSYAEETQRKIIDKTNQLRTAPDQLSGDKNNPTSPRGKAIRIKEETQKILLAAKLNKLQSDEVPPEQRLPDEAVKVISKISEKLGDVSDVSEFAGTYLYKFFSKLITEKDKYTNTSSIIYDGELMNELMQLEVVDPYIWSHVKESLKELAMEDNVPQDQVENILKEQTRIHRYDEEAESRFEIDYKQRSYYKNFTREDLDTIRSIYSPRLFVNYIQDLQNRQFAEDARAEGPARGRLARLYENNPDQYWQQFSETVQSEITRRIAKIFNSVAHAHKDKFMDELAQENFLESMTTQKNHVKGLISGLAGQFEQEEVRRRFSDIFDESKIKFFTKAVNRDTSEYTVEGAHGRPHRIIDEVTSPLHSLRKVDVSVFLRGINFQAETFLDHVLPYNHNVQALFRRGAGQDGTFWGTIANYARGSMTTFDVDTLNVIPDSELIMDAFRLYSKYVKADFAKFDWNNKPGMFQEDYSEPNTETQKQVIEDLMKLHPEYNYPHFRDRINFAMNIAIGVSRGVFLTEPTTVAWADAPHRGQGQASFASYYTNDNAAIRGLNPQHDPDRWKVPGATRGPLLHIPVSGMSRKFMRNWHHAKLWEWMVKRERSYVEGTEVFELEHPIHGPIPPRFDKGLLHKLDQKRYEYALKRTERLRKKRNKKNKDVLTFIEYLPNIGNVGGIFERRGWRMHEAVKSWYVTRDGTEAKKLTDNIDPVETFKALENVGFEPANWWLFESTTNLHIHHDVHLGHGEHAEHGKFTDEFGRYMYDKYINTGYNGESNRLGMDYDAYVGRIKQELRNNKKKEELYPGILLHRAMAHMLRQRTPSLLMSIERTRKTESGIRAWQKIREEVGFNGHDGINKMDRAVKNIMLVEQKVRSTVSQDMRAGLSAQQVENQARNEGYKKPDLSRVQLRESYNVTEDRFKRELAQMLGGTSETDVPQENRTEYDEALTVFRRTQAYLDDDYMNNFADKMARNGKPEKIFPFAIAAEETDTSFMAFKNAGEGTQFRMLGEIGEVEKDVLGNMWENFIYKLHHVALVEHKFDPLVTAIHHIHDRLDRVHGEAYANEVADRLARVATAYFKVDNDAKTLIGRILHSGRPHSLAAEFAGGSWKGVWEWHIAEQDTFYRELDRLQILPDRPKNLNAPELIEPKKFLGIKYGYKRVLLEEEADFSGLKLRSDFGATKWDMVKHFILVFGSLAAIGITFQLVRKALEENERNKGR